MADSADIIFSDKLVVPTEDLIFSILGDKKALWEAIMRHVGDNYSESAGQWNYYNDGHRWLFKMVRKKKTIFWLAMLENTFKVSFYFPDKAEPIINESELPEKIKEEFRSAKKYGAIRGISIIVDDEEGVDNVLKLISIKSKIK